MNDRPDKCRGCGVSMWGASSGPFANQNITHDEADCLASKLGTLREALECLLPGLMLDLRYAVPDDDKDAMHSRIKTVTEALEATK